MSRGLYTIILLICSNVFMTLAWYGSQGWSLMKSFNAGPLYKLILISWGIAFFEYCFMVPANKLGSIENQGPFNLLQLKTIQEVISLTVFLIINIYLFKGGVPQWNHYIGFALMILAVYFIFIP